VGLFGGWSDDALKGVATKPQGLLLEIFHGGGHVGEAGVDEGEDGVGFEGTVFETFARNRARQDFYAVFDFGYWPDVKFVCGYRVQDFFAEH